MGLLFKTRFGRGARLAACALPLCGLLIASPPPAGAASISIKAPAAIAAPAKLPVSVRVSSAQRRIALFVDGKRRWARRIGDRRFGHLALISTRRLGLGRHRLVLRTRGRGGRVAQRKRFVRVLRRGRSTGIGTARVVGRARTSKRPASEPSALVADASPSPGGGFEDGLIGWNTAGVGDVVPTVVSDIVHTGTRSGRFVITGSQDRSELILGGDGTADHTGSAWFFEGDEYYYAFSFNVQSMVYGHPGAHNLIMQLKGDGDGSPNLGLQLWDYAGDDGGSGGRGLWTHGAAMGGDRFLRPIDHNRWYDVVIHFRASHQGDGFYRVYLNGELLDSRDNVSTIQTDSSYAYIKTGLYRNGGQIPGTSEIRLDSARLGKTMNEVVSG